MITTEIQLLTTRKLLQLPPPTWLIQGLLPTDGLIGLSGKSGDGKSFIALDWAMHISQGMPWLGRQTNRAPAVYIAAEGGRGIQKRVRAWMKAHGRLDLPGMYFMVSPLYVREEGVVEAFCDALGHLEHERINPGLVVIDTLARSFGGGEENSSADMGDFMARITELSAERRASVLVVHHLNATGTKERGHTSFKGGLDAGFLCSAEKNGDRKIVRITLTNNKQKDDEEGRDLYLQPKADISTSLVFEEAPAPEKKERGTGGPKLLDTLGMLALLGASEDGYTWKEWKLVSRLPKDLFNRRRAKLEASNEIYKEDGRYYVTPSTKDLAEDEDNEE